MNWRYEMTLMPASSAGLVTSIGRGPALNCKPAASQSGQNEPMTIDDNKALVRRFISEIFEQGRVESVDELCAEDFIGHTWVIWTGTGSS